MPGYIWKMLEPCKSNQWTQEMAESDDIPFKHWVWKIQNRSTTQVMTKHYSDSGQPWSLLYEVHKSFHTPSGALIGTANMLQ